MRRWTIKLIMRVTLFLFVTVWTATGAWSAPAPNNVKPASASAKPAIPAAESIPLSELGARAGKNYSGEALSVIATESGARLRAHGRHSNRRAYQTPFEGPDRRATAVAPGSAPVISGGKLHVEEPAESMTVYEVR